MTSTKFQAGSESPLLRNVTVFTGSESGLGSSNTSATSANVASTNGISIRIFPHYRRHHAGGGNYMTPDFARRHRRQQQLSPDSAAVGNGTGNRKFRRRFSDGCNVSAGESTSTTPSHEGLPSSPLSTSTVGSTTTTLCRPLPADNEDFHSGVEWQRNTGAMLSPSRLVDERSSLLVVSGSHDRKSYSTMRSKNDQQRVFGRRALTSAAAGTDLRGIYNVQSATLSKTGNQFETNVAVDKNSPRDFDFNRRPGKLTIGPSKPGTSNTLPTLVTTAGNKPNEYHTSLSVSNSRVDLDESASNRKSAGPKTSPSKDRLKAMQWRRQLPLALAQSAEVIDESPRRRRIKQCLGCFKSFIAFLCSTIGLTCLLVGYTILGGFVFLNLEAPNEMATNADVRQMAEMHVEILWNNTKDLNVFHPINWTRMARQVLRNYTKDVFVAIKEQGWDGQYNGGASADEYGGENKMAAGTDAGDAFAGTDEVKPGSQQWSFEGALLYSVTVITTIGYGHIAPKTPAGKIITMLYAIVGIPLTLLTITNLGGFMATAFRWFYKNIVLGVCCCRCCSTPATRRRRRKRDQSPGNGSSSSSGGNGKPAKKMKKADDSGGGGGGGGKEGGAKRSASALQVTVTEDGASPSSTVSYEVQFTSGLRRTLRSGNDYNDVHVPIYVSLLLMFAYINLGAMIFTLLEKDYGWSYLIGCYFCFITLSTIGFGDYVPGTSLNGESQGRMVLLALYLIVGLSLLAMCFDLMQEEVRRKFRVLGTKIGLFEKVQPPPYE